MMHDLPMRALRLVVVSLLVAAGITVGAPAGYAARDASLTLSPAQGSPDASFTVTYRYSSSADKKGHGCVSAVTFRWDSKGLGPAASVPAGDSCVATLQAAPPPGTYRRISTHTISVGGDGLPGAHASYTVIPGPPASTRTPSAGAHVPTPGSTDTATVDPQLTSLAEPAAANPSNPAAGDRTASKDLTGFPGWIVALGTLLFLAGAGAFGVIAWRARRPKPEADADPDTDAERDTEAKADAEPATQPLPTETAN
jgi:hypothetical protein